MTALADSFLEDLEELAEGDSEDDFGHEDEDVIMEESDKSVLTPLSKDLHCVARLTETDRYRSTIEVRFFSTLDSIVLPEQNC